MSVREVLDVYCFVGKQMQNIYEIGPRYCCLAWVLIAAVAPFKAITGGGMGACYGEGGLVFRGCWDGSSWRLGVVLTEGGGIGVWVLGVGVRV